jgi:hypothetical protein
MAEAPAVEKAKEAASGSAKEAVVAKHALQTSWSFWYDKKSKKGERDYNEYKANLHKASTAKHTQQYVRSRYVCTSAKRESSAACTTYLQFAVYGQLAPASSHNTGLRQLLTEWPTAQAVGFDRVRVPPAHAGDCSNASSTTHGKYTGV